MSYSDIAARTSLQSKRGRSQFDKWLFGQIFKAIGQAPVRLVLGDGSEITPAGNPVATVVIRDRKTLVRLAADPEMAFGEAYSAGLIQVEGDLVAALEAVYD